MDREWHEVVIEFERAAGPQVLPEVSLDVLLDALRDVLRRAELFAEHSVQREALSVRERMSQVLAQARAESFTAFHAFFTAAEGRAGVVVTLIAILELIKAALIEIVQNGPRDPIYVKLVS
jgi:segregation and condensation protein A